MLTKLIARLLLLVVVIAVIQFFNRAEKPKP